MRVTVDQGVCREYANCVVEAPEVFDLDEQSGKAFVAAQPEPGQHQDVRAAAAACPVHAITLAQ